MSKFTLILIGLSSLFVLLFFSLATHPFEVPDEQSHYATVHYLVSEGSMPVLSKHSDLSLEEEKTEYLLGIMSEGNNRYSYHPEFRLPAPLGYLGLYEAEIHSFNTQELRRSYTIHQAAIYPPLYYLLTAPFYLAVQSEDILTRLFVSRLSSVALTVFLVIVTYLIGNLIFEKKSYGYTLALMTFFFPMTVYIGSGVSSDNLHNLLFTLFLYYTVKYLKFGPSIKDSFVTGLIIALDILTKPQAYIMLPILIIAIIMRFHIDKWRPVLLSCCITLLPVLVVSLLFKQPQYLDPSSVIITQSFAGFVRHYLALIPPLLVWYWGVFKWFGVVLPRPVWWVANRLVIAAGVGLLYSVWKNRKTHQSRFLTHLVIFAILANLTYLGALLWFDWQFYEAIGRSLGFQARYLMPLLSMQMFLLLYGLVSLGSSIAGREFIRRIVVILFLILHFAGLYTMISSYYDFTPFSTLLEQISQYKPIYAKGNWWYLWFTLYFTGIITSTITALKSEPKS